MNDDDMLIQLEHVINTIKCANHALAALAVTGGVLLMQQLGYIIKT